MYVDDNCEIESKTDNCSTDDCNTSETARTCNVG